MDAFEIPPEVLHALLNDDEVVGTVHYPLNEAAIEAQKRHEAMADDLILKMKTAALALKLCKDAMHMEHGRWREEMVKAHPELSDYSFGINTDTNTFRLSYRKGQQLFPGDKLETPDPDQPKPPGWVEEMMNDPEFKTKH